MNDHAVLPGSRRSLLPKSEWLHAIEGDEVARLTVRVRSLGDRKELLELVNHVARQPVAKRKYLTHSEFTARYGARRSDLDAVEKLAAHFHLRVARRSEAERTIVLEGRLGDLLSAFPAQVAMYRHPSGTYRGREGELRIPKALSGIVTGVFGFDTRPLRRGRRKRTSADGPGGLNGVAATEFAKRYDFPDRFEGEHLDGSGETLAIIELGGGYRDADLHKYFAEIGGRVPSLTTVSVDGAKNEPNGKIEEQEVMLDIEVAGSIVPHAELALYFAPNTGSGFLNAVSAAVHDRVRKPGVISISWAGTEEAGEEQYFLAFHEVFAAAASLGVTVCASSGDHGSAGMEQKDWDGKIHTEHPACDPLVLGCGGTQIQGTDRVWNDGTPFDATDPNGGGGWATGGGISEIFDVPAYQADAGVPVSLASKKPGRGVPDVALSATNYFTRADGVEGASGGTSASTPLMAALVTRLNQALRTHVGFLNPFLYAHAKDGVTRDVTQGNNAIEDTVKGYSARKGWDAATGLGTPNGSVLLRLLADSLVSVRFTQLACLETTADQGSAHDEPYLVFCSVDLSREPPAGSARRTRVFGDVDESKENRTRHDDATIWGLDGHAAVMADPDKAILLVGLLESDDSEPKQVMRVALEKVMSVVGDTSLERMGRAEVVRRLLKAFKSGLLLGAGTGGVDSDDDLIGSVRELRISSTDLKWVSEHGKGLSKSLTFEMSDDQGKYEAHFEVKLVRG